MKYFKTERKTFPTRKKKKIKPNKQVSNWYTFYLSFFLTLFLFIYIYIYIYIYTKITFKRIQKQI